MLGRLLRPALTSARHVRSVFTKTPSVNSTQRTAQANLHLHGADNPVRGQARTRAGLRRMELRLRGLALSTQPSVPPLPSVRTRCVIDSHIIPLPPPAPPP